MLCPDKINTEEWLDAHRTAHGVGLRSNITIMFGSVEQPVHWARHLVRTRDLQKETGGFTEFVPLPFVHMADADLPAAQGPARADVPGGAADARRRPHRLSRADRQHPGVVGEDGRRPASASCCRPGANDLGGTLMDENISRAAGASHGQGHGRVRVRARSSSRSAGRSSSAPRSTDRRPLPPSRGDELLSRAGPGSGPGRSVLVVAEQVAGHDHAVHLVGAVVDAGVAGLAVHLARAACRR